MPSTKKYPSSAKTVVLGLAGMFALMAIGMYGNEHWTNTPKTNADRETQNATLVKQLASANAERDEALREAEALKRATAPTEKTERDSE